MEEANRQKTLKAVLHYFYQDNTRSGSHCRYSLQYHLVWIPKYRRSFLVGEIAERLKQILKEIARDYRIRIIAMEVMPDHIHHAGGSAAQVRARQDRPALAVFPANSRISTSCSNPSSTKLYIVGSVVMGFNCLGIYFSQE